MTTPFEVPLSPEPQRFTVSLAGVTYTLKFRWCPPMLNWVMDIGDAVGVPIATGLPLITGASPIEQLTYLGIEGEFSVQTDHNVDATPTLDNLGIASHLYFLTNVLAN